jgi:hypothetical protein
MTEEDYGREPLVIAELTQRRCSLTYGTAPCTATGTPKCYQTWWTCRDRENINTDEEFVWRFRKAEAGILPLYEEAAGVVKTNPLAMLTDVSTTSSTINVGSQRTGESPLGLRSGCTLSFRDAPWDDHVGDNYLADRSHPRPSNVGFWQLWRARNAFYGGMTVQVYEGYRGQALGDMQRRDYIMDRMTGPDANGAVTIHGKDPLRLTEERESMFPRATDIRLVLALDAVSTAVRVFADVADLDADFGNTGSTRYARFGTEIISYTGRTLVSGSIYDLTGVVRGALGSTSAAQSINAVLQRVGRWERLRLWEMAADLIDNHTPIPVGYRDATDWDAEGNDYLITQVSDGTIVNPTRVESLLGELCQQGSFSIWWDERDREIKLLANRPPKEAPTELTDRLHIIAGSAEVHDEPDYQITRVAVYYAPRNPFDVDKPENYRTLRLSIDGEVEAPAAADAQRTLTIYARFVTLDASAFRLATRLLLRYRLVPKYLRLSLDAKSRAIRPGAVVAVTTAAFCDTEGGTASTVWQVLKAEETDPGHTFKVELQSFFFIGRFGFIMPATATDDYATATDEEKATGCYIADHTTGLLPGGDDPYLIQ